MPTQVPKVWAACRQAAGPSAHCTGFRHASHHRRCQLPCCEMEAEWQLWPTAVTEMGGLTHELGVSALVTGYSPSLHTKMAM